MSAETDLVVIGAGPYGLSIGAHLAAHRAEARVFGPPMQSWRTAMPRGMMLKSEGFASCLYEPGNVFTLAAYCRKHGLAYQDIGLPVPIETFVEYGLAFQRSYLPQLDTRQVDWLERMSMGGFLVRLEDGEELRARRVVVATGISHFERVPTVLATGLPGELVTHSSAHADPSRTAGGPAGKHIVIVGAGASAMDLAALLGEHGAKVTVLARRSAISWCGAPAPRTVIDKVRAPVSGLGTGWRSLACVKAPLVFHAMPQTFRAPIVQKHLGPAPGWVPRAYVEQQVDVRLNTEILGAREVSGRAKLDLRIGGAPTSITADHVIAATGYWPDLHRLPWLSQNLQATIRTAAGMPALDRWFGSSVPGLYFVGLAAALSFGPLMRFACGAAFVAPRLAARLTGSRSRVMLPSEERSTAAAFG